MKLNIWRFTDGKSGHDSQSNGLCIAIGELLPIKQFDLSTDSLTNCIKNLLFKEFPMGKNLPDPDIIIGAGHGTHLTMLAAKYIRKGKTIILMKPSLPFYLFDVCVIPKHDCPPKNKNIIETTGALSSIKLNKNKTKKLGLILIGGPSSHYQWDSKSIVKQIDEITSTHTDINWTIADSPRTPKNLMPMISTINKKNTSKLNFNTQPNKDIKKLVYAAEIIWVSPDSVSMVFEALTSGALVGLLNIKGNKKSRIHKAVKHLILNDHVTTFISWGKRNKLKNNTMELNEARRCANILLNRGLLS